MADRIEGLRTKHVKKVSWNSATEHAHFCLFCPTTILIDPVSKNIVRHGRYAAPCTAPHRAGHCTNWACAFVSILPNNDSDWPRFKEQSETRSWHRVVYRASSRHALYCAAWISDALERSRAWFRSCLFMCTLLELLVYQSSYLSTLAGAVRKIVRTVNGISLV